MIDYEKLAKATTDIMIILKKHNLDTLESTFLLQTMLKAMDKNLNNTIDEAYFLNKKSRGLN